MVIFMSHEEFEPVALSMSQGNEPQVSECSAMDPGQSMTSSVACRSWDEINPYDSILNLQAPDFTTLLTILNGDEYWTEAAKHYDSVAHLQDPDFPTLLNFMNSIGYETVDNDGPYDVDKVLMKADAGAEEW